MSHPRLNLIVEGPDGQERRLVRDGPEPAWEIKIGHKLAVIQVSPQDVHDWIDTGTIKQPKK